MKDKTMKLADKKAELIKEFIPKARRAFEGQFPNDITMNVPRSDFMSVYPKQIKAELWEFIVYTLDEYAQAVREEIGSTIRDATCVHCDKNPFFPYGARSGEEQEKKK